MSVMACTLVIITSRSNGIAPVRPQPLVAVIVAATDAAVQLVGKPCVLPLAAQGGKY